MRIIGLDLSLRSTGIVIFSEKVEVENITPEKGLLTFWERCEDVTLSIIAKVQPVDVVFIEDYAYGKFNTITALAELGGIVKYMIYRKTKSWPFEISPTALKKFATGKVGKKEDVKLSLFKKYGVEFGTNDEADAFVLAQIGSVLLGFSNFQGKAWRGYELDVCTRLLKKSLKNRAKELALLTKNNIVV